MGDGLFKRGGIWWIRTDPITKREKTTKCRDRVAAGAVRRERERLAADPSYAAEAAPCKTLGEWCTRVIEQKRTMRAESTADFYESKLGHIMRIFGVDSSVTTLTPFGFDKYVKQRRDEGARPTTILKEIGAAKVVANEAARHGAFRGNVKLFKPSDLTDDYEPGERFLLPEELPPLLAELSDKRGAHVALAIAIGSRFSESFRITPSHVKHIPATESELEQFLVYVPGTKTKKSKDTIPVAPPFHGLLRAALPYLPLPPWSNMTRDLDRACERASIPKVTSNDLRRTNASWLIEAGVPDSLVSRLLRHVDERMVRRVYGRARPEKLASTLGGLVSAPADPRQLPPKAAQPAESVQENPVETGPGEKRTKGLKILVSAVQFRPGTQGENRGERENEGGSAITSECQDVSGSDADCQSLPLKNATVDPEAVEFAAAVAEHTADAQSRALLAPGPAAKPVAPPVVPSDVEAGALRRPVGRSKNELAGGFRGVRWNVRQKQWQATVAGGPVKPNGRRKQIHLGFFDDAEKAARTYDAAARKAFGAAARCNFPEPVGALPPTKTRPVGYVARARKGAARG